MISNSLRFGVLFLFLSYKKIRVFTVDVALEKLPHAIRLDRGLISVSIFNIGLGYVVLSLPVYLDSV